MPYAKYSLLTALSCFTLACEPAAEFDIEDRSGPGNGSTFNGAHYNLNVIGVAKAKDADMTGNQGHRIFVPLRGKTRIDLAPGEFQVLDANGTDGRASFQLPHPDADGDGVTEYEVVVRALGKPGGNSTTTACGEDELGDVYCSTQSVELTRKKGKSSFTNVTRDLLYITADIDGDGDLETVPLFDDGLEDYFWEYDNRGLKLAQFRFYPVD